MKSKSHSRFSIFEVIFRWSDINSDYYINFNIMIISVLFFIRKHTIVVNKFQYNKQVFFLDNLDF